MMPASTNSPLETLNGNEQLSEASGNLRVNLDLDLLKSYLDPYNWE